VQADVPPGRRERLTAPLLDCRTGGTGAGGVAVRGGGVHDPGRQAWPPGTTGSRRDRRVRPHCASGCCAIPG